MYGLPSTLDLSFLCGKTLLQVCVGGADLILNFDGDLSITVTSSLGWINAQKAHNVYEDFSEAVSVVATLLNKSVVSARGNPSGTLTLEFVGDLTLELYDDSKQYESYVIKNGSDVIVV